MGDCIVQYRKHEKGENKAKWAPFRKDLQVFLHITLLPLSGKVPSSFNAYKGFESGGLPLRWGRLGRSPHSL